ncbi:MAG TPA: hypothetical protein VGA67_00165 [Candidatus Dojkabacteria bacterium]|jgi:hypothetical protein
MQRFNFNLLPEKPKELVVKEERRETTALYIAFFPLISVAIALGIIIFNGVVITERVSTFEETLASREATIETYRGIVERNIELVNKSILLEEPISRELEPGRFFDLAEQFLSELPFSAEISSYGRESDGSFELVLTFEDIQRAGDLMRVFESIDTVNDPNIENISNDVETGMAIITINFFLVEQVQL